MKSLFALLLFLVAIAQAYAQTGNSGLDHSFANDGILIDTSYHSYLGVNDLKLQPDGKILAFSTGNYGAHIARYQPDGTPDSSFGIYGSRWIDSTAGFMQFSAAVCQLQQDGKIILAGYTYTGGFIIRLNPNGSIDSAFGNNGILYSRDETQQLFLKPDGGILTAGESSVDKNNVVVSSFKANGAVDSAFGINGLCQLNLGGYLAVAGLRALADGQIAVVGSSRNDSIFYIRLFENGQPDTAFCGTGICYTAGPTTYGLYCPDAIIYPDGKALILVNTDNNYVVRLNADATPDSSFGLAGNGFFWYLTRASVFSTFTNSFRCLTDGFFAGAIGTRVLR
jgi:uncharacterized delta-60 repeat protein